MGLLARILPVVNRFASCKSQPPWLDHIWNTDSGPHPLFSQKSSWKIKNELPGQRSAARFGFAPTFDDATRYEYPRCHHQKAQKQTNQNSRTRTAHETTGPQYRRLGPLVATRYTSALGGSILYTKKMESSSCSTNQKCRKICKTGIVI